VELQRPDLLAQHCLRPVELVADALSFARRKLCYDDGEPSCPTDRRQMHLRHAADPLENGDLPLFAERCLEQQSQAAVGPSGHSPPTVPLPRCW
jgi:hypothetical protein